MVALANHLNRPTDHGILEEIQQSHCYSLYIQHDGRWILGSRSASKKHARETAILAFNRSRLPVEIRLEDGTVIFGLRAGYPDIDEERSE